MKTRLMFGDCAQRMKELDGGSVDLVVTSPPYDSLRKYKGQIPFTFEVFKPIAKQLFRITKDGGVLVWVAGDATINGSETGTTFRQSLYFKKIGFNLHDTMIYKKEGPPLSHNRYEQKFEFMLVFSKGKPKTFNPIMEKCKHAGQSRKATTMRQDDETVLGLRCEKGKVKKEKIKGNVWEYGVGNGKTTLDKVAFGHPAIFPEKLVNDQIVSWTNLGDLVLDPFMGSGTTGKMAKKLKRNFIGIEVEKAYFKISKERIKAVKGKK